MALDIIGAGFGRTGTLSLKIALERLGAGRCYHMLELFERPDDVRHWLDAADGRPVAWDQLFEGYRATVDWPACTFWRQLLEFSPGAKVVLSHRPADQWCGSFRGTIQAALEGQPPPVDSPAYAVHLVGRRVVKELTFGGSFLDDDDDLIARYRAHNEAVCQGVDPDQLLVYDVSEGWGPLCQFLGCEVPDEPFPRTNDRAEFRERAGLDAAPNEPSAGPPGP